MGTPAGIVARMLGQGAAEAAAFAGGLAIGPTLRPVLQAAENDSWKLYPDRPPTIYTVAGMVAEGKVDAGVALVWANEQGFSKDVFDALVAGSEAGADFANLMSGWRRGLIGQDMFTTGLVRLGIEAQWHAMLIGLKRDYLSPAEAANARQQQFISADEQRTIAALYGIEPQDADVQFELAGLPPGVETGLQMWRRGIIDQATFDKIVAEGHTKTKYTGDLEQLRRQLLSAATAVRAHLKGHIDATEMHTRGAQWGYDPADMDLWYEAEGRPASVHQIHIGYARGADVMGKTEEEAILAAVAQSDIRPEYGPLLYTGRFTLPSPFVMRQLTQTGVWTEAKAALRMKQAGWIPADADEAAAAWAKGTAASGADPHLTKADTQLWTTLHKAYLGSVATPVEVAQGLNLIGVSSTVQPDVLARWNFERDLERKRLTPAQIKKALNEGVHNPTTGQPYTRDEAIAYLIELGMNAGDAGVFLDI